MWPHGSDAASEIRWKDLEFTNVSVNCYMALKSRAKVIHHLSSSLTSRKKHMKLKYRSRVS